MDFDSDCVIQVTRLLYTTTTTTTELERREDKSLFGVNHTQKNNRRHLKQSMNILLALF